MVKSYGTITITNISLAISYDIQLDNSVIVKDSNGTYSPSSIILKGFSQKVGQDVKSYPCSFSIAESSDGEKWVTTVAKTQKVSSYTYTYQKKGTGFIRFQMLDDNGAVLVQKNVPIISEGGDGYTVFLDNESHTFLGDEEAAIKGESTIVTPIVYKGSTREDVIITSVSNLSNGLSIEKPSSDQQWKNVKLSVNKENTLKSSGTLDINFTADGKQFTKKFSYSIAIKGRIGANYDLVSDIQIVRIKYDGTFVPEKVNFKAYLVTENDRTIYQDGVIAIWKTYNNDSWQKTEEFSTSFLLSEAGEYVLTQDGYKIYVYDSGDFQIYPESAVKEYKARLYPQNTTNITQDTPYLDEETISLVQMGIKSVKTQYYLSTSQSSVVNGSWTDTVPPYNPYTDNKDSSGNVIDRGEIKKYYWQRTVTTYEDNEVVNGAPSLDGELNSTLKSTSNYDIALDQQAMLAKLSQGKDGVFLSKDGKLYINSTYIQSDSIGAGVITGDKITTGLIQSRGKQGGFDIDLDNGIISANKLQVSATGLQIAITKDGNTTFQSLADYMAENGGKMSGDDIVTAINADSTSLSVSAQKLNFNSYKFDLKTDQITIDSDNFKVNSNGEITATGGTIGGYTIGKNTLTSNNTGMGSSSTYWAFWAGASLDEITKDSTSAEFRVSNGGQLYATNATINGSVTATSGKIGGFTINGNTLVGNGSNSIISGGYISGGTIDGASITGGTISGGTITGSTLQSPSVESVEGYRTATGYYRVDNRGFGYVNNIDDYVDSTYTSFMSYSPFTKAWLINAATTIHGDFNVRTAYDQDSSEHTFSNAASNPKACYLSIVGDYDYDNQQNTVNITSPGRLSINSGVASIILNELTNGSGSYTGNIGISATNIFIGSSSSKVKICGQDYDPTRKGEKGDKGDPGDTGPRGPQGPQGPAGPAGTLKAGTIGGSDGNHSLSFRWNGSHLQYIIDGVVTHTIAVI